MKNLRLNYSPIIIFVYNRLTHTKNVIDSLLKNVEASKSELFIFSDHPKKSEDQEKVTELRHYLKSINGFKSLNIIERNVNFGLSKSVISGVTEIVNRYEKVIVLEDDLIVSPGFLSYMNEALEKYKYCDEVISIHGYSYPTQDKLPVNFFLKGADCWGWATWKRGWDLFEVDGKKLLLELEAKNLTYAFDFDGTYPYTQMLKDQVAGKNQSWAVRWYASAFLKGRLTLYPGKSLVQNIGLDNSGTHCEKSEDFRIVLGEKIQVIEDMVIEESVLARNAFKHFFNDLNPSLVVKFLKKIKQILGL
jgi:hypothetical protein